MRNQGNLAAIVLVLTPLFLASGCGQPQIGADREVFKSVDALYTAVSLRDPGLLAGCDDRLKGLSEAGKLPPTASASLASIVDEARADRWESAQDRLSRLIEGQRR